MADTVPILYRNREIHFDEETLEKLKYLNFKLGRKKDRYSEIVNEALKEFFKVKFKKLKIEHYVNESFEADKKRAQKKMEEDAKERDNYRLLMLAKQKIIEDAIKSIKEEEAKTGIKKEPPVDIKRRYINF